MNKKVLAFIAAFTINKSVIARDISSLDNSYHSHAVICEESVLSNASDCLKKWVSDANKDLYKFLTYNNHVYTGENDEGYSFYRFRCDGNDFDEGVGYKDGKLIHFKGLNSKTDLHDVQEGEIHHVAKVDISQVETVRDLLSDSSLDLAKRDFYLDIVKFFKIIQAPASNLVLMLDSDLRDFMVDESNKSSVLSIICNEAQSGKSFYDSLSDMKCDIRNARLVKEFNAELAPNMQDENIQGIFQNLLDSYIDPASNPEAVSKVYEHINELHAKLDSQEISLSEFLNHFLKDQKGNAITLTSVKYAISLMKVVLSKRDCLINPRMDSFDEIKMIADRISDDILGEFESEYLSEIVIQFGKFVKISDHFFMQDIVKFMMPIWFRSSDFDNLADYNYSKYTELFELGQEGSAAAIHHFVRRYVGETGNTDISELYNNVLIKIYPNLANEIQLMHDVMSGALNGYLDNQRIVNENPDMLYRDLYEGDKDAYHQHLVDDFAQPIVNLFNAEQITDLSDKSLAYAQVINFAIAFASDPVEFLAHMPFSPISDDKVLDYSAMTHNELGYETMIAFNSTVMPSGAFGYKVDNSIDSFKYGFNNILDKLYELEQAEGGFLQFVENTVQETRSKYKDILMHINESGEYMNAGKVDIARKAIINFIRNADSLYVEYDDDIIFNQEIDMMHVIYYIESALRGNFNKDSFSSILRELNCHAYNRLLYGKSGNVLIYLCSILDIDVAYTIGNEREEFKYSEHISFKLNVDKMFAELKEKLEKKNIDVDAILDEMHELIMSTNSPESELDE
ncbi:hypothetical protein FZC35_00920 [Candidatus Cytomitobacter indipagum]|uniref:Uncharacterized protein n=1 Tax=Candidatus Cytomitobacter indipagum TaxID=2601575 RepID=A0A5C0UE64_9PROT|nr:hypothetical protein [Candidatus Cytomitobacter indipagum]QEK37943.1 hypothetical protein FZC35_00920 [Candidatus Cytomitobacter indipagum]